jgi:hypothetical protein
MNLRDRDTILSCSGYRMNLTGRRGEYGERS